VIFLRSCGRLFFQLVGPFWAFDLEQMDADVVARTAQLHGNFSDAQALLG